MSLSRRSFLRTAAATSTAFAGFGALSGFAPLDHDRYMNQVEGFGPLRADPNGILDLPRGFTYQIVSTDGDEMDDGLLTPGDPDGMAAFPMRDGSIALVRNHELNPSETAKSAFGGQGERLGLINRERIFDWRPSGEPQSGGVTTLILDPVTLAIRRQHLSLAGTVNNCAGGPTPWGSWLTCEETLVRAGQWASRDHGYVFEVPAAAEGLLEPVPLTAMGRFQHEAVAVDPATGIVYQTEDMFGGRPSVFYRFIPNHPGRLWLGGRLQGLAVRGRPGFDTRNWEDAAPGGPGVREWFDVEWIDLEEIDSTEGDLADRAVAAGCAHFARGEGCWFGSGELYFACTDGGREKRGQIWRYVPSRLEGLPGEAGEPGRLQLFVESSDASIIDKPDNLCVAPWGDLILAEDGPGEQYIRGVTPAGQVYTIARNANTAGDGRDDSEFCGPCFSPDGTTLFVNIQRGPGRTLAVCGPWRDRSLSL